MKRGRIRGSETSQGEEIRGEKGRKGRYRKEMRGKGRRIGWEGRQNAEELKKELGI